ncbi:MAG: hypothetical protein HOD92_13545 [Deltaproteobacteria bacterium]|jgi:hypothetical protein|nr:hypothetical protein [Deltaproteobacteria bacterium]
MGFDQYGIISAEHQNSSVVLENRTIKARLITYSKLVIKAYEIYAEFESLILGDCINSPVIQKIVGAINNRILNIVTHEEEFTCFDIEYDLKNGFSGLDSNSNRFLSDLCYYFWEEFKRVRKNRIEKESEQLMHDIGCLIDEMLGS